MTGGGSDVNEVQGRAYGPEPSPHRRGPRHHGGRCGTDGRYRLPRLGLLYLPERTRRPHGRAPVHRAVHHLRRDGALPLPGVRQARRGRAAYERMTPGGLSNS